MPVTGSPRSARWPDVAWAAFAAVNIAAMVRWQDWQTVPFHFVWVSLTIVYGFRAWRRGTTAAVLLLVAMTTGYALLRRVQVTGEGLDEMTEVPLMSAMFLAMMWHARRRDVALAQAQRATERERDFVRDASHLLRTPITIARGHAELVASTAAGQERRDLDVVVDELARLSRISNRLLMLAAADHPGFTSLRPVDPGALIDTTVERWAAAAPRHFVADNRLAGTLEGDEERLVCALDALIENAVKATRVGDVIVLRGAAAADGTAELEVADLGAGIAPDILPRIFDRFARAPHRDGGTGLGLPMVKAIVEAHRGAITVSSTPGMGTCVRLRLPGYEEAPPAQRSGRNAAHRAATSPSPIAE
jgi:two-component system OmpR family sensor kinase